MMTNRTLSGYFVGTGLLVMALLIPAIASADCIKDMRGEVYCGAGRCVADEDGIVWCSRYYNGDAVRTMDGHVLCGKGQCTKRSDGQAYCSSEIGGAALIDSRGRAHCYGKCEPASAEMCENSRAGSSGN